MRASMASPPGARSSTASSSATRLTAWPGYERRRLQATSAWRQGGGSGGVRQVQGTSVRAGQRAAAPPAARFCCTCRSSRWCLQGAGLPPWPPTCRRQPPARPAAQLQGHPAAAAHLRPVVGHGHRALVVLGRRLAALQLHLHRLRASGGAAHRASRWARRAAARCGLVAPAIQQRNRLAAGALPASWSPRKTGRRSRACTRAGPQGMQGRSRTWHSRDASRTASTAASTSAPHSADAAGPVAAGAATAAATCRRRRRRGACPAAAAACRCSERCRCCCWGVGRCSCLLRAAAEPLKAAVGAQGRPTRTTRFAWAAAVANMRDVIADGLNVRGR